MTAGKRSSDDGLTMVELLVIMIIIGVLGSLVIFALSGAEASAAKTVCESNFKSIQTAIEAFKSDVGYAPTSLGDLTTQTYGLSGTKVGPWLKDSPSQYLPGPPPGHISDGGPYGFRWDAITESLSVGTVKANGAKQDSGTPFVSGDGNCAYA